MRKLGFEFRPFLYLFASSVLALSMPGKSDAYAPNEGQSPPRNNEDFEGNNGPQAGKQYKQNQWTKANPTRSAKIGNGEVPKGHQQAGSNSNAETDPVGQPIQEKNKPKQAKAETVAKVDGGTTKCAFQAAKCTPQVGAAENPFLKQDPIPEDDVSGEGVTGSTNAANDLGAIATGNTNDAGGSGTEGKQKQVQSAMLATGALEAIGKIANTANLAQKIANPVGASMAAKGVQQFQNMQNADNQGKACQANCENAFECMKLPLINVANENAASPCSSSAPFKDEANVIWMVQQMYHKCYVPMAVLFLLPGAVITQVKSLVAFQILNTHDEDTTSPFIGIFRAMMAIFLIPATQLAVSYCIDIGNALTDPVARQVQVETLMNWVEEQAYSTDPKNNDNCIKKVTGGQTMGKLANMSAKKAVQERQSDLTVGIQNMFNTINNMMGQGLEVLNGFQLVMMCYLFLLGPIAAALYAWPASVGRDLFKKAFSSWLDGVIVLSLWKFWWCIVLLCMAVRLQEGGIDPTNQFELYYYTAFMGILVMVPFQPFEFRPGEIVSQVLEKAQQGGGGGGGGGGGKGGSSSGGNSSGQGGSPSTPSAGSDASSNQNASPGQGNMERSGVPGDTKDAGSGNAGEGKKSGGGGTQMAELTADAMEKTGNPEGIEPPPKSNPIA